MKYGCVFISIILQIQQSNIFISLLGQRRDGKEAGTDFIIYLSLNVTIPAARIAPNREICYKCYCGEGGESNATDTANDNKLRSCGSRQERDGDTGRMKE